MLCLALGAMTLEQRSGSETVGLGNGMASVETMPLPQTESANESDLAAGHASYYGRELAGNQTASGEKFNPDDLTAAHRTLPMGSRVKVTNPRSGDSVVVRVNDRGPFHGNRVIDLSLAAAREIGLIRSGSARVQLALLR